MSRLLTEELKKIWSPFVVVLLLLAGTMYYMVFAKYFIDNIFSGEDAGAQFELYTEWAETYGPTLDDSEYEQISSQLAEEKLLFGSTVVSVPGADTYGVTTYDEYEAFANSVSPEVTGTAPDENVTAFLSAIEDQTNCRRIKAIGNTLLEYDRTVRSNLADDPSYNGSATESEMARLHDLDNAASTVKAGYIPDSLLNDTTGLVTAIVIWVSVSILILLSPTIVRDKLHRIRNLQYSSRTGRRILSAQVLASLLSGTALTLFNILVYGCLLMNRKVMVFKDFPLFSQDFIPWVDWTYGTYIMVIALLVLTIGISVSLLTVFFSHSGKGYIGMLLKSCLLMVGLINYFGMLQTITRPFYMFNPMGVSLRRSGSEYVFLGILLLISVVLVGGTLIKQRKAELV